MASAGGNTKGETLTLNIMPMLDIFSILVTFLLMSFSTDPINHDLHEGVELPQSMTVMGLDDVPDIAVSPKELLLNDRKIADVVNGEIPDTFIDQGAIRPLYDGLKQIAETTERQRTATNDKKPKKPGTLTLEMHNKLNFKLMKRIMLTGQQAEFVTFKLAVRKELN